MSYDIERNRRLREDAWFNCAKCGKEVRESEWASLCNDCGESEEGGPSQLVKQQRIVSRSDELYRLGVMLAVGILLGIAIGQHLLPICS